MRKHLTNYCQVALQTIRIWGCFGCPADAHLKHGKLELRSLKGNFLGYLKGVKGYKIWYTSLKPPKCIISRDVTFYDDALLKYYMEKQVEQVGKSAEATKSDRIQFEVET